MSLSLGNPPPSRDGGNGGNSNNSSGHLPSSSPPSSPSSQSNTTGNNNNNNSKSDRISSNHTRRLAHSSRNRMVVSRPVRRRKSVSHYSDDNPNCFTVKPPRGAAAAAYRAQQQQQKQHQQQQQQHQYHDDGALTPRVRTTRRGAANVDERTFQRQQQQQKLQQQRQRKASPGSKSPGHGHNSNNNNSNNSSNNNNRSSSSAVAASWKRKRKRMTIVSDKAGLGGSGASTTAGSKAEPEPDATYIASHTVTMQPILPLDRHLLHHRAPRKAAATAADAAAGSVETERSGTTEETEQAAAVRLRLRHALAQRYPHIYYETTPRNRHYAATNSSTAVASASNTTHTTHAVACATPAFSSSEPTAIQAVPLAVVAPGTTATNHNMTNSSTNTSGTPSNFVGVDANSSTATTTWKPVKTAFAERWARFGSHQQQQQQDQQQWVCLPPPAVTAFCTRQDLSVPNQFITGDSSGGVTLYSCTPASTRPIKAWDQTAAHARELQRPVVSKKVFTWPNAITALACRGWAVLVGTSHELQGLHVGTGQVLFTLSWYHLQPQTAETATTTSPPPPSLRMDTACLQLHPRWHDSDPNIAMATVDIPWWQSLSSHAPPPPTESNHDHSNKNPDANAMEAVSESGMEQSSEGAPTVATATMTIPLSADTVATMELQSDDESRQVAPPLPPLPTQYVFTWLTTKAHMSYLVQQGQVTLVGPRDTTMTTTIRNNSHSADGDDDEEEDGHRPRLYHVTVTMNRSHPPSTTATASANSSNNNSVIVQAKCIVPKKRRMERQQRPPSEEVKEEKEPPPSADPQESAVISSNDQEVAVAPNPSSPQQPLRTVTLHELTDRSAGVVVERTRSHTSSPRSIVRPPVMKMMMGTPSSSLDTTTMAGDNVQATARTTMTTHVLPPREISNSTAASTAAIVVVSSSSSTTAVTMDSTLTGLAMPVESFTTTAPQPDVLLVTKEPDSLSKADLVPHASLSSSSSTSSSGAAMKQSTLLTDPLTSMSRTDGGSIVMSMLGTATVDRRQMAATTAATAATSSTPTVPESGTTANSTTMTTNVTTATTSPSCHAVLAAAAKDAAMSIVLQQAGLNESTIHMGLEDVVLAAQQGFRTALLVQQQQQPQPTTTRPDVPTTAISTTEQQPKRHNDGDCVHEENIRTTSNPDLYGMNMINLAKEEAETTQQEAHQAHQLPASDEGVTRRDDVNVANEHSEDEILYGNGAAHDDDDMYEYFDGSCLAAIWDMRQRRRRPQCANLVDEASMTGCEDAAEDGMLFMILVIPHRGGTSGDASSTSSGGSIDMCIVRCTEDGLILVEQSLPLPALGRGGGGGANASWRNLESVTLNQGGGLGSSYLLVTGVGARGIRVLDADTLNLLQVFGDSVALHGRSVLWQSALSVTSVPYFEPGEVRSNKKHVWLERADDVAARENYKERGLSWSDDHDLMVVGIPHPYKGPAELNSTLYIWKASGSMHASSAVTVPMPKGGCMGVVLCPDRAVGWKLVCITAETGRIWELSASYQSNFAGPMYPVGYQLTDDNMEYIEEEDELDQAIMYEYDESDVDETDHRHVRNHVSKPSDLDSDLKEALRLSMLEQHYQVAFMGTEDPSTGDVQVLCSPQEQLEDDELFVVPCRPQIHMGKYPKGTGPPVETKSPERDVLTSSQSCHFDKTILSVFPQRKRVRDAIKEREEKRERMSPPPPTAMDEGKGSNQFPSRIKGKRSRTATVEVVLQASVDPMLRYRMGRKHSAWNNGRGSCLCFVDGTDNSTVIREGASHYNSIQATAAVAAVVPSPAAVSSAEEKELALELLFLSPAPAAHPSTQQKMCGPPQNMMSQATSPKNKMTMGIIPSVSNGRVMDFSTNQNFRAAGMDGDAVVTPSEPSPTAPSFGPGKKVVPAPSFPATCPACRGRMVIHVCGKREVPVDYEAIERAEKERKEHEEVEKQRIRTEKRRLAEAKRREARRKKKEEEERKKIEDELLRRRRDIEERRQQLEAASFELDRAQVPETQPVYTEEQPSMQSHGTWNQEQPPPGYDSNTYHETYAAQVDPPSAEYEQVPTRVGEEQSRGIEQHGFGHVPTFQQEDTLATTETPQVKTVNLTKPTSNLVGSYASSIHTWNASGQRSFGEYSSRNSQCSIRPPESIHIDGTEVKPSTSLSSTDALAALAGLANSMPAAASREEGTQEDAGVGPHQDWYYSHKQEVEQRSALFASEYTGSSERRAAIAHAFTMATTSVGYELDNTGWTDPQSHQDVMTTSQEPQYAPAYDSRGEHLDHNDAGSSTLNASSFGPVTTDNIAMEGRRVVDPPQDTTSAMNRTTATYSDQGYYYQAWREQPTGRK